jgi:hypothetical protein
MLFGPQFGRGGSHVTGLTAFRDVCGTRREINGTKPAPTLELPAPIMRIRSRLLVFRQVCSDE